MTDRPSPDRTHNTTSSLKEFEEWSSDKVRPLVGEKTVVFSPGGSSRWYFLEHTEGEPGYDQAEQFHDYGRHALRRAIEMVAMMFADGIRTVFLFALTPKQSSRNVEYNRHLGWGYGLLTDETALGLYEHYQMGVLFRGKWQTALEAMGVADLLEGFRLLEEQTVHQRDHWLVWTTGDDLIPQTLVPMVIETIEKGGEMPDRAALSRAYYGRAIEHADMFISNNKPSIEGQIPPLLTVGDLYFTVAPTYYMNRRQWRRILYDHLYARRQHYRDYKSMKQESLEDMRAYYKANQNVVLGLGDYHPSTQTWRPAPGPSQQGDSPTKKNPSGQNAE